MRARIVLLFSSQNKISPRSSAIFLGKNGFLEFPGSGGQEFSCNEVSEMAKEHIVCHFFPKFLSFIFLNIQISD